MSKNKGQDFSRRNLFHGLSIATVLASGATALEAQDHAHQHVAEEKKASGAYTAKFFNPHEMATMRRMAELVIPADEGGPSAADVGAHEFIDLICSLAKEIADTYAGGLQWVDGESVRRYNAKFVAATETQQTELLTAIAYKKDNPGDLAPGIAFFTLARQMIVDGYYTTREGFKDVGFIGNRAHRSWDVPANVLQFMEKRKATPQ